MTTDTAQKLAYGENHQNLAQKLAWVMGQVSGVAKRGRNDFHKYSYATEADIMEAVRKALSEAGVAIIPQVTGHSQHGEGKQRVSVVDMDFVFTDGRETLVVHTVGEGQDSGDKGFYKAMTGATKYALLKTFLIPTGDDYVAPTRDDPEEVGDSEADALETDIRGASTQAELERLIPRITKLSKSGQNQLRPVYAERLEELTKKGK